MVLASDWEASMLSYAIRRILSAIPTLFIIITLAFFMMRAAPGGPFDSQRKLPPQIEHNIEAAYSLDKPLFQQYLLYLGHISHGDFGPSYKNRNFTVTQLIAAGVPVSARLGFSAMAIALLVGVTLGAVAALNQNRAGDYGVMSVAMVGITIPTFVTAPLLTLIFGVYGITIWGLDLSLPVGGWNGGAARNVILPIFVLALPQIAIIARLVRGSVIEVLRSNYVRTARAKGLNRRFVIAFHALPNALLPVVTLSGILLGFVLAGSIPVERAFGTPGLGYAMYTAVSERDVFVMQNLVFLYSIVFVLLNIGVDLASAWLDPRIRYR